MKPTLELDIWPNRLFCLSRSPEYLAIHKGVYSPYKVGYLTERCLQRGSVTPAISSQYLPHALFTYACCLLVYSIGTSQYDALPPVLAQ